jgi:hypothetical protein
VKGFSVTLVRTWVARVTVKNQGLGAYAGNLSVRLDGITVEGAAPVGATRFVSLLRGESAMFTIDLTSYLLITAGSVDPDNRVLESNERNNAVSLDLRP